MACIFIDFSVDNERIRKMNKEKMKNWNWNTCTFEEATAFLFKDAYYTEFDKSKNTVSLRTNLENWTEHISKYDLDFLGITPVKKVPLEPIGYITHSYSVEYHNDDAVILLITSKAFAQKLEERDFPVEIKEVIEPI